MVRFSPRQIPYSLGVDFEPGEAYDSFEASEGDEISVTIDAGYNGANAGVSATEIDGIDKGVNWWSWDLEPDEEVTDSIEIVESDEYTGWINEGAAHITIEAD